MKKERKGKKMTSLQAYEKIFRKSILDEEITKTKKIKLIWVDFIPKADRIVINISEPIDSFNYPSLKELRKQFETTGLYNKERIDEIIEAYARLPKYGARRDSAPRGKRRGKKA